MNGMSSSAEHSQCTRCHEQNDIMTEAGACRHHNDAYMHYFRIMPHNLLHALSF